MYTFCLIVIFLALFFSACHSQSVETPKLGNGLLAKVPFLTFNTVPKVQTASLAVAELNSETDKTNSNDNTYEEQESLVESITRQEQIISKTTTI